MALSTRALSPAIAVEGNDGSFLLEKGGAGTDADPYWEGRQYMAVKKGTADNQVKPLEDGDDAATAIVGFLQADADHGESVRVRLEGISWARAQGAVTRGDVLEAIHDATDEDKNGNLQALATLAAAGGMIAAEALEAAADGEYFKIRILKQKKLADA
jgi:hypothetical protein